VSHPTHKTAAAMMVDDNYSDSDDKLLLRGKKK
jgi:hypothetical protein